MNRENTYKCCFVPSCINTTIKAPEKIFLCVPVDLKRKKLWFEAVQRELPNSKSTFYCCEDHFNLKEDAQNYLQYDMVGGQIKMKPGVVPHIFQRNLQTSVKKRPMKKKNKSVSSQEDPEPGPSSEVKIEVDVEHSYCETDFTESCVPASEELTFIKKENEMEEVPEWNSANLEPSSSIMVSSSLSCSTDTSPMKKIKLEPLSDDDSQVVVKSEFEQMEHESSDINFSCSYENWEETNNIVNTQGITKQSNTYLGIPESWNFLIDLLAKKTEQNESIVKLVLMKIQLNDSLECLSHKFDLCVAEISTSLINVTKLLATKLKSLIFWPKREVIKINLPIHFRHKYRNVQGIIDCFEIEIENPSDIFFQSLTLSEAKRCSTIKYLISITPDGFINFISGGYGGRIANAKLFEMSGIMKVIPKGCDIISDSTFSKVEPLLETLECSLVVLPSLLSDENLSETEVFEVESINALKTHIEKGLRRIRKFEFIKPSTIVDTKMLDILDDVVIIAAALCNLQNSLDE